MSATAEAASPAGVVRSELKAELAEGVTAGKLLVMVAALISLFVDQSFAGMYGAIQAYVGGTLGASTDELSWTNVGYNACYYTLIILTPWLIGRLGRRLVFGLGHVFFALTSFYLSLTGSLHGFIVGRCIEGFAQGTFFVCSVATVLTLFPAKYRGYAFSIFSVVSLSGAASGSFVGGWFVDHAYWRGAIALYGVMALFAGLIVAMLLEAPPGDKSVTSDWTGAALAFVAFFSYQFVLAYGERRDWFSNEYIAGYTLLTVIAFAAFVLWELHLGERAFLRLGLFSIGNLRVGSILGFGLGAPLFGANEFLQYASTGLGFPPSTAGALLTLRIVAIVVVAPAAVLLVNADKINVKIPVALGFMFVPVSYALLATQTTFASNFGTFVFALVLSGAGFACLFSPVANVTIRSLPQKFATQGIAIFKMVLLLGGSAAAALLGVIFDHSYAGYLSLVTGVTSQHTLSNIGVAIPAAAYSALAQQQAAVLAFADNSKWVALLALVNLPLIFFLKPPPKS